MIPAPLFPAKLVLFAQELPRKNIYPRLGTNAADTFFSTGRPVPNARLYEALELSQSRAITEEQFLTEDLQILRDQNPSLDQLKKKMNVQGALILAVQGSMAIVAHFCPPVVTLMPVVTMISHTIAERCAGAISSTALGGIINKAAEGIKAIINSLPFLRRKGPVTFAGDTQESRQNKKVHTLAQGILKAFEQFKTRQKSDIQSIQPALELAHEINQILNSFIRTEGSQADQQKLLLVQSLQADVETLALSIPTTAVNFNDLTISTQKQMMSVIYKALTSQIDPVVAWGREAANALGIHQERINHIISSNKKGN